MSRTWRKASHRLYKRYKGLKIKDGSRTHVLGSCQRGGNCPYCFGNRMHKYDKQPTLEEVLNELSCE